MTRNHEMILIKNGELTLKGLNRNTFEVALMKNLRRSLRSIGEFDIQKSQSAIFITPKTEDVDLDAACERVKKVFGIAAFSRALMVDKSMDAILQASGDYFADALATARTFKVETRRADKTFPKKSPEISADVGEYLLDRFPHLTVDVHEPDVTVIVEIRDFGAYIHALQTPGAGGMPVGTGGKCALLISGGIDSPVAAYMIAKRGVALTAIHFASPPYTSERAEQKVISLLEKVTEYAGRTELLIVPFTRIQEEIRRACPEDLFTLIMRRFMMRIAARLAEDKHCEALVTGESIGQVASQTIPAMACTEAVTELPVFRPLIGMDKEEIVTISRKIDTFDISIQPYEDCCTVFTPRHPRTRPKRAMLEEAEKALAVDELVKEAADGVRRLWVG
ncbi:MAG: tRNA 4-thiouridine(8) synthase ThiI [Clostridia bacterium]|nr:tRNA 4-thiouridine(8) synthase ThiI [Clostridia bacterium]